MLKIVNRMIVFNEQTHNGTLIVNFQRCGFMKLNGSFGIGKLRSDQSRQHMWVKWVI